MEWRSVQVWLPRVSTSGGQSMGRVVLEEVVAEVVAEAGEREVDFLVRAAHSAMEVQVRQLCLGV